MATNNNSLYYTENKNMTYIYLYLAGWLFITNRMTEGVYKQSNKISKHPTFVSFCLMSGFLFCWPILAISYIDGFFRGLLRR